MREDKGAWEHWSIGNYDVEQIHREWDLEIPRLYMEDKEVRGVTFHMLRQELVQVEMEMDGVGEKEERDKQEVKRSAWNHIREILVQCYEEILHLREGTTLNGNALGCMWQSRRRDEEDDGDGDEDLICTMRGNDREALPYPIVVDSGASSSILPKDWCQHDKLREAVESKQGQTFNATNGKEIGRRAATSMTREGAVRDVKFVACNATRALGSVSQMCRAGHRVAFNPPWYANGSYTEHTELGQKTWLTERERETAYISWMYVWHLRVSKLLTNRVL